MSGQKRDFDTFAYDDNFSTPSLPGITSFLNEADGEIDVQWLFDDFSVPQSSADAFGFQDSADVTQACLTEQCFDPNEGQLLPESLEFYGSSLEPLTQESTASSSSNDTQILECVESKDVCYGMIYLSKAKFIGSMADVRNELNSLTEDVVKSHYLLNVIWNRQELFVVLPSGLRAAQLNRQISEALQESVERKNVRLQALASKEAILNDIGRATTAKESETFVNLNVYGSHSMLQSIGACLSKAKVWLQRPDWHDKGSTYENPHVICFGEEEQSDTSIAMHSADVVSSEQPTFSAEGVYSRLSRAAHLEGVAGDSRLKNKLLPHQEEALAFMMQREHGDIPDQFRLWVKDAVNDATRYRHKITGQRAMAAPSEHGGGILADEMGTGKTLSAIALIIATLEAAQAWTFDREAHLSGNIPAFKTLSRATLVVVPSPLLLETWQRELRKHMKTELEVFVYHGTERNVDRACLTNRDIVLTTYHTLVADSTRNIDLITQIAWYRIVLDEAHFVRRTSTLLYKRVAELDANSRWCLTGTPIQNSLDDLGALFAFLRIAPFDHLGWYRKHISAQYAEGLGGMALAQDNLVKLLDAMCIRRTKDQVNLCPAEETYRFIEFSSEERAQYDSMTEDMKRAMDNIVGVSDSRRRFGSFQAKLQLRLLCNHGTYEDYFHWAKHGDLLDGYVDGYDGTTVNGHAACSICGMVDLIPYSGEDWADTKSCVHVLCSMCKQRSSGQCPLCDYSMRSRKAAVANTERNSWTSKSLCQNGYSSKMAALVEDLHACRGDKSIVFSCWTTTLELVARHLRSNGIQFKQIDGRMPPASRQQILEAFSRDKSIAVLIMTTGVGAFGLDIIAANHVFLVEPQWNPSVESQAVGRTTRIGQQKRVQVTRYVVRGTVEEDFQDLQRRKRGIARMAERNGHDGMVKAEHQDWMVG